MHPVLEENNDWRMITSVLTDVLDAQFGVTVLPRPAAGQLQPVIETLSAERYRLVVPIGQQEGKPVVAVGTLAATPGEILEKMLGLAVQHIRQGRQLEEQRLDLEAYAEQISRDFEELTWLRGLMHHLKGGEQEIGGHALAESILEPLGTLIGAQEITLIAAGPDQPAPTAGKVAVRAGPKQQPVDEQGLVALADRLHGMAAGQPLVQTGMKRRREFSIVPEIDSCILVPVVRHQAPVGWLLALNRTEKAGGPAQPPGQPAGTHPEDDFGTFEANLLELAAVVLAAHPALAELLPAGRAAAAEAAAPD